VLHSKLEQLGHSHVFSFVFYYKGVNLGWRDEIAKAKNYRKTQQISSARHFRPTLGYFFKVVHKLFKLLEEHIFN